MRHATLGGGWRWIATPLALLALGLTPAPAAEPADTDAGRPPNIVLIMADDFGYECVTANGGQSYSTPNLDRLAASGMRFERCHVQPLCTPTRVQLMTGQYNIRNYVRFGHLQPASRTFANLLKDAGYATAIVGKWQLGVNPELPRRWGFDEHCLWQHVRRPERYRNPGLEVNGERIDYTQGEYGPDLVCDYALDFITRHKDRPFLLYYPMILTHDPFVPTPDSPDYNDESVPRSGLGRGQYFADMTAYADKLVGRIVARLDELQLRKRTLVIFLGDNGTHSSITSQFQGAPYRGGKGTRTARGTHVPLIVSQPGVVPAGRVSRDLVDSTDFLPTMCAAAGVKLPQEMTVDGRSFWPQLGGATGQPRPWIYCWYARNGGPTAMFEFAHDGDYKLYRNGELYDLRTDLDETKPLGELSPAAAAAKEKLSAALAQFEGVRPARFDSPQPPLTPPARVNR